ncbi:SH3 domain-containing protein [Paracoccus sp. (in: a-proteobacteria)]|uniref:SH3 domain-containing protein n=1 Tax=Paracoccus sp. TaxID=267 RepID=UPI0026E0959D|nr:SH3 domain-containing protein [Paracoccus sp. (in: a-proteobacteria)]MDO5647100.1 SH3 domain-containing protein [Paracoccus sp. (in: a-proteobacteria)]
MLRIAVGLILLASPALATPEYVFPSHWDVAGVAADDVLNIRAEPDARADIIGTLPPDARTVEVVDQTRNWLKINSRERSGWVAARYMTHQTGVWQPDAVPPGFSCYGTEPFWSARVDGGDLVISTPDIPETRHAVQAIAGGDLYHDLTRAVLADGATLVSTQGQCSDGMSDRDMALRATLIQHGPQPAIMTGCCTIQDLSQLD